MIPRAGFTYTVKRGGYLSLGSKQSDRRGPWKCMELRHQGNFCFFLLLTMNYYNIDKTNKVVV